MDRAWDLRTEEEGCCARGPYSCSASSKWIKPKSAAHKSGFMLSADKELRDMGKKVSPERLNDCNTSDVWKNERETHTHQVHIGGGICNFWPSSKRLDPHSPEITIILASAANATEVWKLTRGRSHVAGT
jgi:hypothetical protein